LAQGPNPTLARQVADLKRMATTWHRVSTPLRRSDLHADPFVQFARWHAARAAAPGIGEVDAVALATASAAEGPSVRMVLLKGFDERGLRFFTNTQSRKGRDLAANPRAALLLYDAHHNRQARAEGRVVTASADETDAYWRSRAPGSRLSAAVSEQSRVVSDRATMLQARDEARARWSDELIPRPEAWQGYRLEPEQFEFWQHGDDRFHDRFRYERASPGEPWRIARLWP